MKKQFLETGKIVGTHGLNGEVRVESWSDNPEFLTSFNKLFLDPEGKTALRIKRAKVHKNVVLMKINGYDSIEEAESLRGKVLYLDRGDVRLQGESYFIQDLLGASVYDIDTNELLGELADVSATGANDVWHIKNNGKIYLIPAIPSVVINVDTENDKIEIRPLKGIFDL